MFLFYAILRIVTFCVATILSFHGKRKTAQNLTLDVDKLCNYCDENQSLDALHNNKTAKVSQCIEIDCLYAFTGT